MRQIKHISVFVGVKYVDDGVEIPTKNEILTNLYAELLASNVDESDLINITFDYGSTATPRGAVIPLIESSLNCLHDVALGATAFFYYRNPLIRPKT